MSLESLKGVGAARLKALQQAGIEDIRSLLEYLPVEYRNLSDIRPLALLSPGDTAAVKVRVAGGVSVYHASKKLSIIRVKVQDESAKMTAVWYNQPWLKEALTPGRELLLWAKCEQRKGESQLIAPAIESGGGLKAVYKPIAGIAPKLLSNLMDQALEIADGRQTDALSDDFRQKYQLCERNFALYNAHHPADEESLAAARRRLAFEELLLFQTGLWMVRGSRSRGIRIDCTEDADDVFWQTLPFEPTGAQRRVLKEVIADMRAPYPMARLVQGDVGSGKTAVALAAMYACVKAGWQCALMAPTEILASQHMESAKKLLEPLGIRCGLLTGSLTPKKKREAHEAIASGEWQAVIGTHALITEAVEYKNLGLVITDEQHRFGVRQRSMLSQKGASPNVLVMSATPIPRTLSLILYGDLDISIVDELPPGRTPVKTGIVSEAKRKDMYGFLRSEVQKGRQVYVVCPLIEESEAVDALPAEAVYEKLRTEELPDLRVALVHGRIKAADKEAILNAFHRGELDVLVSTTVIEVGVNVPNASVMVIENAERFGLAQLHQLRGRVGRGAAISYCFLMAEPNQRLRLLVKSNDGFEIAQKDMEIRGPGDLFGVRQSGELALGACACAGDSVILKQAHDAARELLKTPDSEQAQQIIRLAKQRYPDSLSLALN